MRKFITFIYIAGLVGLVTVGSLLFLTVFPVPGLDMDARVVQSGSMEPAIPTGSVIFIRPSDSYKVGDVITFSRDARETPTTHRIVEFDKEEGSFTTKGDANKVVDMNPVKEDLILGSVRFHIPFLGYAVNFARKPLGLFLLVIIPATLIALDEIRKIAKAMKERGPEKTKTDRRKDSIKITSSVKTNPKKKSESKRKVFDIEPLKSKDETRKNKKRIQL